MFVAKVEDMLELDMQLERNRDSGPELLKLASKDGHCITAVTLLFIRIILNATPRKVFSKADIKTKEMP